MIGEMIMTMDMINKYGRKFLDWFMSKLGSIAIALIFLAICFKVIKIIVKLLRKAFDKSKLDKSVAGFFISAIRVLLQFLVVLTAASMVGFQITSFITLLGTAGVTIGLALQGSLSNLAGGVLILILKPFKVGDYIVENSTHCEGVVVSIDIFYTRLRTYDNRTIVIPNGTISNTSLVNISGRGTNRVDVKFFVAYESDLSKVKQVVLDVVDTIDGHMTDKPVEFFIEEFGESGIEMYVRFFTPFEKSYDAKREALWKIKEAFDANGIEIPYNKLDVNIKSDGQEKA